ncbi:hypothetical protein [Paraglaciecola chathamensis]|uniref:hypothetical protein n=1 Tax=Paraglaciecola chathamensis TaxID=368405 RepID=UPI002704B83C|nr:hypothetical protein [Paraglaciecola chathamensis]MDO6559657.1 hypothetical protein [Paraglaciecola chathamensis]
MRILFLVPSKLDGPSARYVIDLSKELYNLGVFVIISSESENSVLGGELKGLNILNIKMPNLDNKVKIDEYFERIIFYNIDLVYAIGSRVKIDILALHFKKMGLLYFKQLEDDEQTIFLNCNKNTTPEIYEKQLEKGYIDGIKNIELSSYNGADYKVVDPYLKGLSLSILDGYSKIWGGLFFDEEKYLLHLSSFTLPPVSSKRNIEDLTCHLTKKVERINEIQYFIGGSIYSIDDAIIFISAWILFKISAPDAKLKISRSRSSKKLIEYIIKNYDGQYDIEVLDLPDDSEYQNVLLNSQFVVSVGGGEFDEKRLPSRLVKAMYLGKTILAPSVGFGKALTSGVNAVTCSKNTSDAWLEALNLSYNKLKCKTINSHAISFANSNFNVDKIASDFKQFVASSSTREKPHDPNSFDKSFQVEHLMKADAINISLNSSFLKQRKALKTIKFRLVHVGNALFIQTLERADYQYQVDSSVESLLDIDRSSGFSDSGFKSLSRLGEIGLFNRRYNKLVSNSDMNVIFNIFRGNFKDFSPSQRSYLFDKFVLSYRLFIIIIDLVRRLDLSMIFFHADMQPVEAIISSLLNKLEKNVSTISLQHALFYETDDGNDVNIVNLHVSPSKYSFLWDEHVSDLVCKYNSQKVAKKILPTPSYMLKDINPGIAPLPLLVILDGPNHEDFNLQLLEKCDLLIRSGVINSYHIKPHPYHSREQLNNIDRVSNGKLVQKIERYYNNVFFISSTLGYELSNAKFFTFQYKIDDFESTRSTVSYSDITLFSTIDENLVQQIIGNIGKVIGSYIDNSKSKYKDSFYSAAKSIGYSHASHV